MTSDRITLLRSLKGAPASIILALVFCGHAMTNRQLEQATGYSDKPISKGLALLELHGLTQYNGYAYGWSLTAAARQLPLFPDSLLDESRNISESRRISDSFSSSSYMIFSEREDEEERNAPKVGDFPTSVDNSGEIRRLLIDAGVGRRSRKLRELLTAGLTAEYVQAHVSARETAVASGKRYPVGWLIQKLLDGDPVPNGAADPLRQQIPDHLKGVIKR